MTYLIYKITNKTNNKVYIGQTRRSLKIRWWEHCKPSNNACFLLKRAILKYGKESFNIEEICRSSSVEDANKKEKECIAYYKSSNPEFGYNYLEGGSGFSKGHSLETKDKISKSVRSDKNGNFGKPKSQEFKAHMSNLMKNRIVPEETRQKISEKLRGKNNPNFGKHRSEEWKAKASIKQKMRTGNVGAAKNKLVIELTTGIIFDSLSEASDTFDISRMTIWRQLNNIKSQCHGKKFELIKGK